MDEKLLREVKDRLDIEQMLYRYCRAMDRIDHQLGYSVFAKDAIADYGPMFQGTGHGFIDWVCEGHKAFESHSHQLANPTIRVTGDVAASETYVTVALRQKAGEGKVEFTGKGRYIDKWARQGDGWVITHRIFVQDFDEIRPVAQEGYPGWGKRDRDDPSYAVLGDELA